jgi:hypothetical protein
VASVPIELNTDQQRVIDAAQATAFVSIRTLTAAYSWTEVRASLLFHSSGHNALTQHLACTGAMQTRA